MAKVAVFMGPMARKKRVTETYVPNSYRVISHEAEKIEKPTVADFKMPSNVNMLGQSAEPKSLYEHRKNRPNATSVGFLSQDVRLLNEPICHVQTRGTSNEQQQWWPSRANPGTRHVPNHTLDTTFRQDYQRWDGARKGSARHTSNPNIIPALGAVPVNFLRDADGAQRVWREKISYEHKYNCRQDPQYPIRAKRHGAFVWDRFSSGDVQRMVDYYGINPEHKPKSASLVTSPSTTTQIPHSTQAVKMPLEEAKPSHDATTDVNHLSNTPVLPPIDI